MSGPIAFYDLRTKREGVPISPNTWKTRLTLNIKGLDYKTVWLSFTEIPGESAKLGVPKTDGGYHTVPSIADPATGRAITDSFAIAEYLDKQYPDTPALIPAGTRDEQIAFMSTAVKAVGLGIFPFILDNIFAIIEDKDKEYFRASREKLFGGKKLEEIAPKGDAIVRQAKGLENALNAAATVIAAKSGEDAIFYGGDRPLFADVALGAIITSVHTLCGDDHIVVKTIFGADGGRWAKFAEAISKWTSTAN